MIEARPLGALRPRFRDGLNRRRLEERLDFETGLALRHATALSVVRIDLEPLGDPAIIPPTPSAAAR